MKKIFSIIAMVLILSSISITAHAESYEEAWLRKQIEEQEKYMDDLAADGNLTQEAIDSISKGTSKRKPNKKSKEKAKQTTTTTTTYGKGWVYSTDELHVIGLPENENGYTKAGWYGD